MRVEDHLRRDMRVETPTTGRRVVEGSTAVGGSIWLPALATDTAAAPILLQQLLKEVAPTRAAAAGSMKSGVAGTPLLPLGSTRHGRLQPGSTRPAGVMKIGVTGEAVVPLTVKVLWCSASK